MRVYGRLPPDGNGYRAWVVVTTDSNGFNDAVYITALAQCCLLNYGESPFFGQDGIPALPSVIQQLLPDFYVARIQQKYSKYFTSLTVQRVSTNPPTYNFSLITKQGYNTSGTIVSYAT